jgi:molybdate transport system substrate-binding protein
MRFPGTHWIAALIALIAILASSGPAIAQPATQPVLRVSAAISLVDVLRDLQTRYGQDTAHHIELNVAASGQLMAQIRHGAPVDLFISAAHEQIDALARDGLVDPASVRVVARNRLVLVVTADSVRHEDDHADAHDADSDKSAAAGAAGSYDDDRGFAQLADARRFKRIAVGDPRTVPAGEYARQVLDHLKLADALRDRLVYTVNVRQAMDYVLRGEVDAGIVYRTDARSVAPRLRIVATAGPHWHQPIEYSAAIVRGARHTQHAERFLEYLQSPDAQAVFVSHGFGKADEKPASRPSRKP